jgi:hypothetical protein
MSIWTHVAGMIRVDHNFFNIEDEKSVEYKTQQAISKIFISSLYEKYNAKCNMPNGSEDSLQFKVILRDCPNSVNVAQIAFWGDLRDYDYARAKKEFKPWLKKVVKKLERNKLNIRQLSFLVSPEDTTRQIIYAMNFYGDKITETEIKSEKE